MTGQALTLRFGADVEPARRALRELVSTTAGQMGTLRTIYEAGSAASVSPWLRGLGSIISAIGPVRLALLGLTAASVVGFQASAEKLEEYTALLKKAQSLGTSVEFMQGFTKQVEAFGGKVDEAEAALRRFQTAAKKGFDSATFSETDSPGQQKLDELFLDRVVPEGSGQGRAEFMMAENADQQIQAVLKSIRELQLEGQKLASIDLAESFFGSGVGSRFADEIERGTVNVEKLIATGIANGSIVSNRSADEAAELTRRLGEAAEKAKEGLLPILQDIASLRLPLYNFAVQLAEALAEVARQAGIAYNAIKKLPTRLEGSNLSGDPVLDAAQAAMGGIITPTDIAPPAPLEVTVNRPGAPAPPRRPLGLGGGDRRTGGGGGRSPAEEIDQIEKFIEAQMKANDLLKVEIDNIGKSNVEKERGLALAKLAVTEREKGVTASDEERARIIALAEAQGQLKDALASVKSAQEGVNDAVRFAGQAASSFFSDFLSGGENAEKALMNLSKRLLDVSMQALLLGDGPLAGFFGTKAAGGGVGGLFGLLSGGFGGGATASVGAPMALLGSLPSFDVGTSRVPHDMIAKVHKDEMIVPAYEASLIRSGRGSGGSISIGGTSIVVQGNADSKTTAMITAALRENNKTLLSQVEAQRRRQA